MHLLDLSDGAVSVPAEDLISAQTHMSAQNELEAGEEYHTFTWRGRRSHFIQRRHAYPYTCIRAQLPENFPHHQHPTKL